MKKTSKSSSVQLIAGVDEAGRGALVGPVIAAAVILPEDSCIENCCDSKKLTAKQRVQVGQQIENEALAFALGGASAMEIDEINILQASLLAMKRALENLSVKPNTALIDGLHTPAIDWCSSKAIVGGDQKVLSISAASILAKVARDEMMRVLHEQYPVYQFDRHKGYPTRQHLEALRCHGICPEHRKTYKPVHKHINGLAFS